MVLGVPPRPSQEVLSFNRLSDVAAAGSKFQDTEQQNAKVWVSSVLLSNASLYPVSSSSLD